MTQGRLMAELPWSDLGAATAGPLLEATLVMAGPSRNGTWYPAATLEAAAAKFKGLRCYLDHAATGDKPAMRSVAAVVGRIEEAWFAEDRIRGRIRLSRTCPLLRMLLEEGLAGELSLTALGTTRLAEREGRLWQVVEELTTPLSVDFVSEAAAGGQVDALLSEGWEPDRSLTEWCERSRTRAFLDGHADNTKEVEAWLKTTQAADE